MYIGLYISGLSLVTTIGLTYLCLIEGVISFGTRTQSVTLLQSEAPVLYLLLAPFSIALPSCFILFGWRVFQSARLGKPLSLKL